MSQLLDARPDSHHLTAAAPTDGAEPPSAAAEHSAQAIHGAPWQEVAAACASMTGPLRLGQWECADDNRLSSRPRTYRATLAVGDRIESATASAGGPVAALTAMLHDRGIAVETLRFHQIVDGGGTTTFIRGSDGRHAEWAMGSSPDGVESALRAVIACANRLLTAAG